MGMNKCIFAEMTTGQNGSVHTIDKRIYEDLGNTPSHPDRPQTPRRIWNEDVRSFASLYDFN